MRGVGRGRSRERARRPEERAKNPCCRRWTDAGRLHELGWVGVQDPLERAEAAEERPSADRTHRGKRLEDCQGLVFRRRPLLRRSVGEGGFDLYQAGDRFYAGLPPKSAERLRLSLEDAGVETLTPGDSPKAPG